MRSRYRRTAGRDRADLGAPLGDPVRNPCRVCTGRAARDLARIAAAGIDAAPEHDPAVRRGAPSDADDVAGADHHLHVRVRLSVQDRRCRAHLVLPGVRQHADRTLDPRSPGGKLFRSLGAGTGKTFRYVLLPTAAPLIFAGLRIGLTLALAGAIVAEFVSAQEGLGLLVQRFGYQLNLDDAFAVVLVLTVIGWCSTGCRAARPSVFWRREAVNRRSAARTRREQRRIRSGPRLSDHPRHCRTHVRTRVERTHTPTQLEAK